MDEDEPHVYEVKSIIDSRKKKGVVKYRVRWVGYTEFEDTWEMLDMLVIALLNCKSFGRSS